MVLTIVKKSGGAGNPNAPHAAETKLCLPSFHCCNEPHASSLLFQPWPQVLTKISEKCSCGPVRLCTPVFSCIRFLTVSCFIISHHYGSRSAICYATILLCHSCVYSLSSMTTCIGLTLQCSIHCVKRRAVFLL